MIHPVTTDYVFSLDSIEGQGYCLSIKSPDEKKSYFGSWSNTISERFDGRRLTLSGYIKTEAVNNGYAGIWIRVDPDVSFANMNRNGVKGDSDWKRYELTVPYSQSAEQIVFGGMLIGDSQSRTVSQPSKLFSEECLSGMARQGLTIFQYP